jgi:hypothetical protein
MAATAAQIKKLKTELMDYVDAEIERRHVDLLAKIEARLTTIEGDTRDLKQTISMLEPKLLQVADLWIKEAPTIEGIGAWLKRAQGHGESA